MKIKFLLLTFCCVALVSCRTYNVMQRTPSYGMVQKLPNMELQLDESSFISIAGKDATAGYIKTIFSNDMYNNFVGNGGATAGKIVCRAVSGSYKTRFVGLSILSGISLCVFNLFGLPFGFTESKMSISCEVYDANDKLIASFISAEHSVKKYAAMYYGYYDWEQVAPAEAFRICMDDINRQFYANYKTISDGINIDK